ncbi:MAG: class I SAM-dependent methyltransferase [Gaiellaceae bacterium]
MAESHNVVWTPEKVAANWDFFRERRGTTTWLFAKHAGRWVVERADRELQLRGRRVLDFRCGPGDLLLHLFGRGIAAQGVEPGANAVAQTAERFRDEPLFRGVSTSSHDLADGSFDVVFFVEGVEHLLDDEISPTLAEIKRLLAPGGAVFATAPNAEDLESTAYRCPDCGGVFHQYQHMRSLDAQSTSKLFEAAGFRTEKAGSVYWGLTPYAKMRTWLRNSRRLPTPHLFYIGRA